MRTLIASFLLLATAQPVEAQQAHGGRALALEQGVAVAQQVLAAERAFDADAAHHGQWTAFRNSAAADAVMFVPHRISAQQWLAGRADPAQSVRWQPHSVFVSCDGQLATTSGFAQEPDGSQMRFRTIWQRQPDGSWKWVLDAGWPVASAPPPPAEPAIQIANCTRPAPRSSSVAGVDDVRGSAPDGSLTWMARVDGAGRGFLALWGWNGNFLQQISSDTMGPARP